MKKFIYAALALVFAVSCSDSEKIEDTETTTNNAATQSTLEGTWVVKMLDGVLAETNSYFAFRFNEDNTQDYVALVVDGTSTTIQYKEGVDYSVIDGLIHLSNDVDDIQLQATIAAGTIDGQSGDVISYYEVSNIQNNEYSYSTITYQGIRVDVDYSDEILGVWVGVQNEDDILEPFENIQMDFLADGTLDFKYLDEEDQTWKEVEGNNGVYCVMGTMLYTQWEEPEYTAAEGWEIVIDGDEMTWSASRGDVNPTAGFTLTRSAE